MLSLRHSTLALSLLASAFAVAADEAQPSKEGLEFFEKNVRPILIDRCYECHSAEKNSSKGGLILDSRDGAYKGGDEGPSVVPGNLEVAPHQGRAVHRSGVRDASQEDRRQAA